MLRRALTLITLLLRPSSNSFCSRDISSGMDSADSSFRLFEKIPGKSGDHLNSVLFSKASGRSNGLVVYFGGDGNAIKLQRHGCFSL